MANSHPEDTELVRQLFCKHVPEVASGTVEIRGIVRNPGKRSALAVSSKDPAVDAVGACTGIRGSRAKAMVTELGEYLDIVLWNDSAEKFIGNLLAPMRFMRISLNETTREAWIVPTGECQAPSPERLALQSSLLRSLTSWNLKLYSPRQTG